MQWQPLTWTMSLVHWKLSTKEYWREGHIHLDWTIQRKLFNSHIGFHQWRTENISNYVDSLIKSTDITSDDGNDDKGLAGVPTSDSVDTNKSATREDNNKSNNVSDDLQEDDKIQEKKSADQNNNKVEEGNQNTDNDEVNSNNNSGDEQQQDNNKKNFLVKSNHLKFQNQRRKC